ncbi:hypothetical protein [Tahibacter caeni]|uniref:hypothetical protein n=1 Tax=Tahibacter caeni TaxID=1453545 RepID=UPI0021480AE8|nr:hypothetical protein [Tahibacter caeni]
MTLRLLCLAVLAAASASAPAATFVIRDHDTDGLIAAIRAAETTREPDRIELAPAGLYIVRNPGDSRQSLGLPLIRSAITIVGNGAEIRRYSDAEFALVGVARGGKLALENLGIAEASRGAIINRGVLHLDRVRVTDSFADGANAIVINYGTLRGWDSEISHNAVLAAKRDAGIVLNFGRLELARSRLAGNTVTGRRSSVLTASALLNLGDIDLRDVTIEGNSALAEPDDTSSAHAVVNLGNGSLQGERVTLVDNWPEEANVLPVTDPDMIN